jgi:hypothetical protein
MEQTEIVVIIGLVRLQGHGLAIGAQRGERFAGIAQDVA